MQLTNSLQPDEPKWRILLPGRPDPAQEGLIRQDWRRRVLLQVRMDQYDGHLFR